jgi:hypothetical protein
MDKCFQQSDKAYARGQVVLGEELLEQGKQHECTMEALNAEASAWIFRGTFTNLYLSCVSFWLNV